MDLRELPEQLEARHPWERARVRLVQQLIESGRPSSGGPIRILDVGAGDGWLAWQLASAFGSSAEIVCFDRFYDAAHLERLNSEAPANVRHVSEAVDVSADLVLALDVIEHVEDDRAFVAELAGYLVSGGRLVATVPAHQWLFGPHDVALGHYRRYSRDRLTGLLDQVDGLTVDASGQLFYGLLVARAAQLRWQRRRAASEFDETEEYLRWSGPEWLAGALTKGLVAEGRAGQALSRRGVHVPGLSCWATAHKS